MKIILKKFTFNEILGTYSLVLKLFIYDKMAINHFDIF